jgi:general secretion pathway protein J
MTIRRKRAMRGFTLIEALVSVALMGVILAALATVTAQWLPSLDHGFVRVQRNELIDITLDRLVADLGAAEFVTQNRNSKSPLFDGRELAVTFVRSALGPNTKPGLQVVRIAESADRLGPVLVRSQAPFAPSDSTVAGSVPFAFANPAPLLRAPYRVSFAYAGRDGVLRNTWRNEALLPATVRLVVRDAQSERILAGSTVAVVHVDVPAACVHPQNDQDCAVPGIAGTADVGQTRSPDAEPTSRGGG